MDGQGLYFSQSSRMLEWAFISFQFDTNGDGQISTAELREAMRRLLGQQLNHHEVDEILNDVDLNGDGLVDFGGTRENRSSSHVFSFCFTQLG